MSAAFPRPLLGSALLLAVLAAVLLLGPGVASGQGAPAVSSVAITSDAGDDDTRVNGQPATALVSNASFPVPDLRKMVSNIGQDSHGFTTLQTSDLAQRFTTGSNSHGYDYTLTSVEVEFSEAPNSDLRVRVVQGGISDGTVVATLTNPSSLGSGVLTFTASAGTTLAADTSYFVLLDSATEGALHVTTSIDEDSGRAHGWSIEGAALRRNKTGASQWSVLTGGSALKIRLNGRIARPLLVWGITGGLPPPAPEVASVTVGNQWVTVNFTQPINAALCPDWFAWNVTYNGAGGQPVAVYCDERSVRLFPRTNVSNAATTAQMSASVRYQRHWASERLQSINGAVDVPSFDLPAVGEWPLWHSASVNGDTVTITFDQPLDESSIPPGNAFLVDVFARDEADRDAIGVRRGTAVSIDGNTVTVTLDRAVPRGESLGARLHYRPPDDNPLENPIRNEAGQAAKYFDNSFTNYFPVSIVTP